MRIDQINNINSVQNMKANFSSSDSDFEADVDLKEEDNFSDEDDTNNFEFVSFQNNSKHCQLHIEDKFNIKHSSSKKELYTQKPNVQADEWIDFIENCQLSWIDEVMFQLKPYVFKCEGIFLIQNNSHLILNYKDADTVQALSFIKAIFNEFEAPLKNINVIIEHGENCLIFKLNITSKENFLNFLLYNLMETHYIPQFLFVMGGDESFEGVFRTVNKFEKLNLLGKIFCCNVGERISNAKYYLNNKKEAYSMIKSMSKLSIPELKSKLGKSYFMMYALNDEGTIVHPKKRHMSCKNTYNISSMNQQFEIDI